MLQGHLRSLSGNGESQRRKEEETSCEAHHFGRWSVSQHPVPKSSRGRLRLLCEGENTTPVGIYLVEV
jgi:hypothetical protein